MLVLGINLSTVLITLHKNICVTILVLVRSRELDHYFTDPKGTPKDPLLHTFCPSAGTWHWGRAHCLGANASACGRRWLHGCSKLQDPSSELQVEPPDPTGQNASARRV